MDASIFSNERLSGIIVSGRNSGDGGHNAAIVKTLEHKGQILCNYANSASGLLDSGEGDYTGKQVLKMLKTDLKLLREQEASDAWWAPI